MISYAVYSVIDGKINSIYSGTEKEALLQGGEGDAVIPIGGDLDDSTAYITGGTVQEKQSMSLITTNTPLIADGADEVILSGIPSGVQVRWPDGQTDIVTGGEIRFSVDLPGTYTFQFTAIPYLDKEVTIEAVAAT